MKYGILGDVHANLSALEAALRCFEKHGVEQVVSVGDVVGYGAAPRECIQRVREADALVVKGNHDAAVVREIDLLCFNAFAREAVLWTRGQLEEEELRWLASLPLVADLEHCTVAHSTLYKPELYGYIQTTDDADPSLNAMELPVCFIGHSHVPVTLLRLKDDPLRTAYTVDTVVELGEASRSLCNVGSVGQPRDEDPRAAYAIYDSDKELLMIERVEYDIEKEATRIREAGLPPMLADRLFLGV